MRAAGSHVCPSVSPPSLFTLLAGLALVLAAAPVAAQQPVAVIADRVLDVESGELVEGRYVVVRDGRIEAVASEAPADADVIDLGDATLMPGWIDAHVRLDGELSAESFMHPVQETAADAALRGAANARKTVEAGFTTVRNVGSGGFTDVALRDAVRAVRYQIKHGAEVISTCAT